MKKFALLALIAAAALVVTPKSAFAGRGGDDAAVAAIGGFIGGLVIGAALDNDHDRYDRSHVAIGVGYGDRHYGDRHYRGRGDGGYWKTVTVKHWVPGYWTYTRGRHGHRVKVFVEGHWDYRTDRVWVSYDRHDRHDRRYGYDHGYRR